MGILYVLMHVTPRYEFLLAYLTYVNDTGYQWAPLHFVMIL